MRIGESGYGGSRVLQRNAVAVEITLNDGGALHATLFPPVQGRISDLLNDERDFLPVESDGQHFVLAKTAIRHVRMPSASATQARKSPCSILGLPDGASIEEIKRAYHELCLANHPDRIRGAGLGQDFVEFANQNMIRINNAYAQLTKGAGLQAA